MRKSYVFRIMEVLMLITLVCSSIACLVFGGEFSSERLDKIHEEDKSWSEWLDKYIRNVIYVGMPVNEFVKLFTKSEPWPDLERPYILSHKDNSYIFVGRKGIRYKVTFRDGLLEKLEQYTWEKIPLITAHYKDFSHLLRGYKPVNSPGFYDEMTENEFLSIFANSILSHSKNRYVVVGKNGWKYRITFSEEGFLIGIDTLQSN